MRRRLVVACAIALATGAQQTPELPLEERLARHRNLGKAFYENPTTQNEALEEFRKALALAPDSIREQLNYALALIRAAKTAEGIAALEKFQQRDPRLPHTWFNLGIQYKKAGENDKAIRQFERMVQLVPDEPISRYNLGSLYRLAGRNEAAIEQFKRALQLDPHLAAAHFQLFNLYRVTGRLDEGKAHLAEFQRLKKLTEGAAVPEDVEWSAWSEIYEIIETAPPPPPGQIRFTTAPLAAMPGAWLDTNNDGLPDAPPAGASGYAAHAWIDFDHDYDMDLLLFGKQPKLLRNQGKAGFEERTAAFPFEAGDATGAAVFRVTPDTRGTDVLVTYRDRSAILYRDLLLGKFEASKTPLPAGAQSPYPADLDNDGAIDLLYSSAGKAFVAWNDKGTLAAPSPLPLEATAVTAVDLENRGVLDVVAPGKTLRNLGGRRFSPADLPATAQCRELAPATTGLACAKASGSVVLTPVSPKKHNFIRVRLNGVRNLKRAYHAEVEVKAGPIYAKKIYRGEPLTFGVPVRTVVDVVRITWPNGLIQNEVRQPVNRLVEFKEAQRLSGSCPIIWSWNGREFEYITDVLGVAPLGAASGDGEYFPTDHDEYVQIRGEQLRPVDGKYEIRITEELSEVAYLDQVRLIALDHPATADVYTNEKFKGPPFPEFRLFGAASRVYPVRALDSSGRDVREKLTARDRTYPDQFPRDLAGVAAKHDLTLTFPHGAGNVLIMHGWVDWADGSTFLRLAQEGNAFTPPYLQVKDRAGKWVTVIEDMGMPAGKPKTIAVDLTGKWLSGSREVRIVTSICIYWDEIFLAPDNRAPETRLTPVRQLRAGLRFRGFSPSIIHPQRTQPEAFSYNGAMPVSLWNPTPGRYTRYGDVAELTSEADDRLIVMGSGDELRMLFDASSLPPLTAGWRRDFLLLVDGWAKDRDANTVHSQTTEPLPFHGMSRFPYPAGESFPSGPEHREYLRNYQTRDALRLIRPLATQR